MRSRRKPNQKRSAAPAAAANTYYELEVIPGLREFAQAELQARSGDRARLLPGAREDRVRFRHVGNPGKLLSLRRAVAVSRIQRFAIPRPKALLGQQNLETLIGLIKEALVLHPPGSFETFHISAAGSSSQVFARIKTEIQVRTGLRSTAEVGDLLLAVRRPQRLANGSSEAEAGWEVAVRLSPRPLSARPWRVCDMPGALNGTVASTMMSLTHPSDRDRVVNLACGSATLLIERLDLGPLQSAVGCDIDAQVLACARQNLAACANPDTVMLLRCDAGQVPLPSGWATVTCADLPFGMLLGSHRSNQELYPRLLAEAGRLTVVGGRLVVITQEVRLFERVVTAHADQWAITRVIPIKLPADTRDGYIRPRIYLLLRLR
jgi:predicted RNA methylase